MIEKREVVESTLSKKMTGLLQDPNSTKLKVNEIIEKYDFPAVIITDYVTLRKPLVTADDFTIYVLAEAYLPNKLEKWFSAQERKKYSRDKFSTKKIKFPLRFKMIKIAEDQFIGQTTVDDLMLYRDAQLINYNTNAQRTMKHIVKHDEDYYQISLNKRAVNDIRKSYESSLYIPDTITLNIPEDARWYYNEEDMELVIRNIDAFDITDGFHRYVAMQQLKQLSPDFNYSMELRLTCFSEGKARQFIWQQDQKTKMSKVDSESMDNSKLSNRIVERLNNDSQFILASKITRNVGLINAAQLANVIEVIWLSDVKKSNELSTILEVHKNLVMAFEELVAIAPDLCNKPWDKKLIFTAVYESKFGSMVNTVRDYELVKNDNTIYNQSKVGKKDLTRIQKLLSAK